jgi:hypothetical protein
LNSQRRKFQDAAATAAPVPSIQTLPPDRLTKRITAWHASPRITQFSLLFTLPHFSFAEVLQAWATRMSALLFLSP